MKSKIRACKELYIETDLNQDDFYIDFEGAEDSINENIPVLDEPLIWDIKSEVNNQLETLSLNDIDECYIQDNLFYIEFVIEYINSYNQKELSWLANELIDYIWNEMDETSVYTFASGKVSKSNWNPLSDYGYYETKEDLVTDECKISYSIKFKSNIKIEEVK